MFQVFTHFVASTNSLVRVLYSYYLSRSKWLAWLVMHSPTCTLCRKHKILRTNPREAIYNLRADPWSLRFYLSRSRGLELGIRLSFKSNPDKFVFTFFVFTIIYYDKQIINNMINLLVCSYYTSLSSFCTTRHIYPEMWFSYHPPSQNMIFDLLIIIHGKRWSTMYPHPVLWFSYFNILFSWSATPQNSSWSIFILEKEKNIIPGFFRLETINAFKVDNLCTITI